MLKSVKYFDMSHTPWCSSSSWAFCVSAGEQLTFFTFKSSASPPPGKSFHEEPWLAVAAVPLGFFPWTPWIKTLWGSHFSCVALQVSLSFFFPASHPKLGSKETLGCCFFVGPELALTRPFFFPLLFVLWWYFKQHNDKQRVQRSGWLQTWSCSVTYSKLNFPSAQIFESRRDEASGKPNVGIFYSVWTCSIAERLPEHVPWR